jgi:hypothetical protein
MKGFFMAKTITVVVGIWGGAGTIIVNMDDAGDTIQNISSSTKYTVALDPGKHVWVITGTSPTNGHVDISIFDNQNQLTHQSFNTSIFNGVLRFVVAA